MKEVIEKITEEGKGVSPSDKLEKVYTHSALEFQRIDNLLKNGKKLYEKVFLLSPRYMTALSRYLERLKKIRNYYYETTQGEKLPDILRPPIVEVGKIIRVKKERKPAYLDEKERALLHLTFDGCRAKHLEMDGRIVIVVEDELS